MVYQMIHIVFIYILIWNFSHLSCLQITVCLPPGTFGPSERVRFLLHTCQWLFETGLQMGLWGLLLWDPLSHLFFLWGFLVCGIIAVDILWCYELKQVNFRYPMVDGASCNFARKG